MSCCGKVICNGCIHAPVYDDQGNVIAKTCPFCRTPAPTSAKEIVTRLKKGTEKNEAGAFLNLGVLYSKGAHGLPQNHAKALELWQKAEELGSIISYFNMVMRIILVEVWEGMPRRLDIIGSLQP